jgi:ABC-2 type transport system ATP-binding protein
MTKSGGSSKQSWRAWRQRRKQEASVADPCVIETIDLRKRFGGVEALRGLDLRVPPGSICGFLGRNGAGKTTTIKVLLGITKPSAGSATVFGLPCSVAESSAAIRRRTGFVSEDKGLYDSMTVDEMIRFTASFFPTWRRDLEDQYRRRFPLAPSARVKALSRGGRTQLALLLALCRGADLLVLDEPTSGLDPAMVEQVLQALVAHVGREETTVFFSSHQIVEVEQIADRVAIIEQGRTVLAGALDDLREAYCRVQLVFDREAPDVAFRAPGVQRVRRQGRVLTVLASGGAESVVADARALHPTSIDVFPVTLKEIFLDAIAAED